MDEVHLVCWCYEIWNSHINGPQIIWEYFTPCLCRDAAVPSYHAEWVNMILNYTFLYHSLFPPREPLFYFLFADYATVMLERENLERLFGVWPLYKMCTSECSWLRLEREDMESGIEEVIFVCLINWARQNRSMCSRETCHKIVWTIAKILGFLVPLCRIRWVRKPLATWKPADFQGYPLFRQLLPSTCNDSHTFEQSS